MAVKLGPVLNFRGVGEGGWRVSVLVASDDAAAPTIKVKRASDNAPKGVKLNTLKVPDGTVSLWRYDLTVKQTSEEATVTYGFGNESWDFVVPPEGTAPRMAYGSCNGFSSLKLLKSTNDPNALWRDVAAKHDATPFHLLLLGGDQVYSDSIWEELHDLAEWAALPTRKGVNIPPTPALVKEIQEYYAAIYPRRWMQPEPRDMLASIPTIMMWDDHDIFDGWGSYAKKLQECDMYEALFESAREAFSLYQQQLVPGQQHPLAIPGQKQFSLGTQIGNVALLALDMRSERSGDQVISPESWKAIYEWLGTLPDSLEHLFVMSSIPVVYPDFQLLENALGFYPGRQELEDDLRDHWTSQPHREERLRLIHRLLAFSEAKSCRVTILSGDVHVGAIGLVRSERSTGAPNAVRTINQLTSSGIVHPAPPGIVLYFLESTAGTVMNDDSGVTSHMIEIPGTHHRFIGGRNWLALNPDTENRYWANWHLEGAKHPYTKVVHPVGFEMPKPKLPEEANYLQPA